MPISASKDKKSILQAHKEKILQELKYYEKRVEGFRATVSSKTYYEEGYSSDSEDDFPSTYSAGPSLQQVKLQKAMLQICLQATQELTSLQILQSEVNVMVDDPVIKGEPPVLEPGVWREVTAECRIDLIPFSIMFCVHKPHRKFAPSSYRCLKVLPVKNAHEAELSKSVLPGATLPSDAIEVIRSYAEAYRSRRTSLARLADKYAQNLFMEPMAEGGYILKCADLLEVSWRLENKWSPVSAFHHKMKFDIEYMDESYIKIITQAHKQLSDPSIETDERTLLLAKIITTCLEAQGPTQKLYESMDSDPETKKLEKRRTTLDEEVEAPIPKKRKEDIENRDDEIMAPPKSLPKKVKPKGKENMNENRKPVKRAIDDGNVNKAKVAKNGANARQSVSDIVEAMSKQNETKNDNKNDKDKNPVDNEKSKGRNEKSKVENEQHKKKDLNQNEKIKAGTSLKNVDKETTANENAVNKTNNGKKSKNKQDDGNRITDEINTKSNDRVKANIPSDKDGNVNIQENIKKKTNKAHEENPQKDNKEKKVANSKNVLKTKEPAAEKLTGKNKDAAGSKKDTKSDKNVLDKEKIVVSKDKTNLLTKEAKIPAAVKAISKDKKVASSKTKLVSENNAIKGSANAQNGETRKVIDGNSNKAVLNDKPQPSKNVDKRSTKENEINDKVSNGKDQTIPKTTKDNGDAKAAEKKTDNAKKLSKPDANIESIKPTVKATLNKQSINQNVIKVVNNKETNIKNKTTKPNKDKNVPENTVGNKTGQKLGDSQKELNSDKIPTKNAEAQKNVQKAKITNPKNIDKIKDNRNVRDNAIDKTKINVNPKNNAPDKNTATNSKEKGDITEKSVKEKNVASRNNEYVSNVIDTDNNNKKISEVKPQKKIVIKNLSHNNPSAQNKLHKKSTNVTDKAKACNTVQTVKYLKTGNTRKEGSATKTSKIPQMKMSPFSDSALPRNPLRISPRKIPSTFKSTSDSNLKRQTKLATNIPRLVKNTDNK